MPWYASSSSDSLELTDAIWEYKLSQVHGSTNPIVTRAVEDYAQAASTKYPVFPHDDLWMGHEVPNSWCTEFAAWGYRQGAADVSYGGYEPGTTTLPEAEAGDEDIGIRDFLVWAGSPGVGRTVRYFGRDEEMHPELQNGPTYEEWEELADGVKEGDYVARNWEEDVSTQWAHSMIAVGWLADDDSEVGPQHFDPSRHCNRLLVVDGNIGSAPYPGTQGLGSIVTVSKRVVCRQSEDDSGYSVDPYGVDECIINGETKKCGIRLWDFLPNGSNPSTGGFFIDMERY